MWYIIDPISYHIKDGAKKYKLQTAYEIRIYNYGVLKLIQEYKRMKYIIQSMIINVYCLYLLCKVEG